MGCFQKISVLFFWYIFFAHKMIVLILCNDVFLSCTMHLDQLIIIYHDWL